MKTRWVLIYLAAAIVFIGSMDGPRGGMFKASQNMEMDGD